MKRLSSVFPSAALTLLLIALVGLVAYLLIKFAGPPSGPVSVGLLGYTNACAIITVTNRSNEQYDYTLMVERKTERGWPQGWPIGAPAHQAGSLRPGQITTLRVPVMVYVPSCPWRISLFCNPPFQAFTQVNPLRLRAAFWLQRRGMRKWATKLLEWHRQYQEVKASTPEMQQWEK